MKHIPVITIDGPGGTGKGTVARRLAKKLNWHLLESGVLYRVLALAANDKHQISLDKEADLALLAAHLDVQFLMNKNDDDATTIILEGENVSGAIRTEICGNNASKIATFASVRAALLGRQRAFLNPPGLVAEGRDMGTIVFPDAEIKIFLDATIEERAKRRYCQLKEMGNDVSLAAICMELEARDYRDRQREFAPLVPAKDALVIDTTELSVGEVLEQICKVAYQKFPQYAEAN